MNTDPIADYLTRLRNANSAGRRVVDIPFSKLKFEINKIFNYQCFILSYKKQETNSSKSIKIALKYDKITKEPVIKKLKRVSTPGLRKYVASVDIPRVLNGLGIAIISTSQGILTGKQAKKQNVGGEVLCYVF